MRHPFNARPPSGADAINETIRRALATAGLDTTAGPTMHDVTETTRRAEMVRFFMALPRAGSS
jgi:hypothetical protein